MIRLRSRQGSSHSCLRCPTCTPMLPPLTPTPTTPPLLLPLLLLLLLQGVLLLLLPRPLPLRLLLLPSCYTTVAPTTTTTATATTTSTIATITDFLNAVLSAVFGVTTHCCRYGYYCHDSLLARLRFLFAIIPKMLRYKSISAVARNQAITPPLRWFRPVHFPCSPTRRKHRYLRCCPCSDDACLWETSLCRGPGHPRPQRITFHSAVIHFAYN